MLTSDRIRTVVIIKAVMILFMIACNYKLMNEEKPERIVAKIEPWSDLESLDESMETQDENLELVSEALKNGSIASAKEKLVILSNELKKVQKRSRGFTGMTPKEFQKRADDAVTAANELRGVLNSSSDAAVHAAALKKLRGTCRGCHNIYRED